MGQGSNNSATAVLATALACTVLAASAGAREPVGGGPACRHADTVGTSRADLLIGTPRNDVICAFGGDDWVLGRGGEDVILAGRGADEAIGGRSEDRLLGQRGRDELTGAGDRARDLLDCGSRSGTADAGPEDRVVNCDPSQSGTRSNELQPAPLEPQPPPAEPTCTGTTTPGLIPLNDLGHGTYRGAQGGLYPDGVNQRPAAHEQAGTQIAADIGPVASDGTPDPSGRYGFVSIGMSITRQEFAHFLPLAAAEEGRDPQLVIINGAQDGRTAAHWAVPANPAWAGLDSAVAAAGLTAAQVQVAWLEATDVYSSSVWPDQPQELQTHIEAIVQILHDRFPNLRIVYVSSVRYNGYATIPVSPEPVMYESGFGVRWAIQAQLEGDPGLNWDPGAGPIEAPWLSWGPYLWANGTTPRSDGLTWECGDFHSDGVHPSPQGADKAAALLLDFIKSDTTAREWFLR